MSLRLAPCSPLIAAVGSTLSLAACELTPSESLSRSTFALANQELDPDDPGPTGPSFDPSPGPGQPAKTRAEALAEAMASRNFTPSAPSTWSETKRSEICHLWASTLAKEYGTALAHGPALTACMTGAPADLGMLAYQTLEMRRRGFMPTAPQTWSDSYRAEVCEVPYRQYQQSLKGGMTGALATMLSKAIYRWCDTYGGDGQAIYFEWEPPTGWDYATWEFAAWQRRALINWGEPVDGDTDDFPPPK